MSDKPMHAGLAYAEAQLEEAFKAAMSDTPRTDAIDAANDSLAEDRMHAYAIMRSHARRLERQMQALLDHCPDAECLECGKIICPHGEPLHFHHDGCPACDATPLIDGSKNG